jgi:hypothetical protein
MLSKQATQNATKIATRGTRNSTETNIIPSVGFVPNLGYIHFKPITDAIANVNIATLITTDIIAKELVANVNTRFITAIRSNYNANNTTSAVVKSLIYISEYSEPDNIAAELLERINTKAIIANVAYTFTNTYFASKLFEYNLYNTFREIEQLLSYKLEREITAIIKANITSVNTKTKLEIVAEIVENIININITNDVELIEYIAKLINYQLNNYNSTLTKSTIAKLAYILEFNNTGKINGPITDYKAIIDAIANRFAIFNSCAITCDDLTEIIEILDKLKAKANAYYITAYIVEIKLNIINTIINNVSNYEDIEKRLIAPIVDEILINIDITKAITYTEQIEKRARSTLASLGKYPETIRETKREEAKNLKQVAESVKLMLEMFIKSDNYDPYEMALFRNYNYKYLITNLISYYTIIIEQLQELGRITKQETEAIANVYGYIFNNISIVIDSYLISFSPYYKDSLAEFIADVKEIIEDIENNMTTEELEEDEETQRVLNLLYYFIYDFKKTFKRCIENGEDPEEVAETLDLDNTFNIIYNYINEDLAIMFARDYGAIRFGTTYEILNLDYDY